MSFVRLLGNWSSIGNCTDSGIAWPKMDRYVQIYYQLAFSTFNMCAKGLDLLQSLRRGPGGEKKLLYFKLRKPIFTLISLQTSHKDIYQVSSTLHTQDNRRIKCKEIIQEKHRKYRILNYLIYSSNHCFIPFSSPSLFSCYLLTPCDQKPEALCITRKLSLPWPSPQSCLGVEGIILSKMPSYSIWESLLDSQHKAANAKNWWTQSKHTFLFHSSWNQFSLSEKLEKCRFWFAWLKYFTTWWNRTFKNSESLRCIQETDITL